MNRDILLFLKHPYAAGIIAVIWISTALLIAIDRTLPITSMILVNMASSLVIAVLGFSSKVKR